MSEDWTDSVPEFLELPIGETTFQIVGEPYVQEGKFGDRLFVPTNVGTWRLSPLSPIARDLKEAVKKLGRLAGCNLTVVRTGKEKDTRYSLKHLEPPKKNRPTVTPPPNQAMLNLDELPPEQRKTIEEMLKPKKQE